jgi:hypothetical protein
VRIIHKLVLVSLVILVASQAIAKTVQVGTCLPHLQAYSTISQAVSSVLPGSTIWVCPGTYPEQVTITQSLTLRGVQAGNGANPIITVPPGGLTKSVLLLNGGAMFFQVLVQGTPSDVVNITDIAVNGTNNEVGSKGWLSGVCFRSTSGSVSRAAIFNQTGNGYGFGIFLESGDFPAMSTVSITTNSIHDFDAEGIRSNANSNPPSLTVSIKGNSVTIVRSPTLYASAAAIDIDGIGEISGNSLLGPSMGIGIAFGSNLSILNNMIEGLGIGMWARNSNTIRSNRVSASTTGIILGGNGNDVESNRFLNIIGSGSYAVGFNCTGTSNTVTHNTINDSDVGVISDPGGNGVSRNSFSNVTTVLGPTC